MRTVRGLTCVIVLTAAASGWCQDPDPNLVDPQEAEIQRIIRERRERDAALSQEPTSLDGGASINPRLLSVVQDNSIGLRYEERDLYFRTLELAIKTPLELQERYVSRFRQQRQIAHLEYARQQAGVDPRSLPEKSLQRGRLKLARTVERKPDQFPAFLDIWHFPEENRGRPVSLHGILRKLTRFDPGQNKQGIGDLYEAWIYCDDSFGTPIVVVFAEKPERLEVSGDLSEEVQVTGYFLKMYSYQGQEEAAKAPLVIAGGLLWRPRPDSYAAQPVSLETYLLVTLVVMLVGYSFWLSNLSEMTSQIPLRGEPAFALAPAAQYSLRSEVSETELKLAEPDDS